MSDRQNDEEFTIQDWNTNKIDEPVTDAGDEVTVMTRGAERVVASLLSTAKERPLSEEETDQLLMVLNQKKATKEFAQFVLSQGREA